MAEQHNRDANLTHRGWQKGQSGNLSGRPHRVTTLITHALLDMLAEVDPKTRQTYAQKIARLLIKCATEPDPEVDKTRIMAMSEILDRVEGKPKQQLDVNDITADLRRRSDYDLTFHLEKGYWPEDEEMEMRKKKILEAAAQLENLKTDTKQ